jgi:hypothetical protein
MNRYSAPPPKADQDVPSQHGQSTGQVPIFGEMVSLFWNDRLGATVSFEEMWNRIIERNSIPLMCTYAPNG